MNKTSMKQVRNYFSSLVLVAVACFATSCDNNNEIKVDPNASFDAIIDLKEVGTSTTTASVAVDANKISSILAKVSFTSTTKEMKRLYITQNISGKGEEIFKPIENIDLKADGSVDIEAAKKNGFEYSFKLAVPSGVTGTVVYKFWTTTGNGDFRDQNQRLAVGPGTITLTYGGSNTGSAAAPVKSYSEIKLVAPLANGTSQTFVSLLDGKTYNVNQGIEYVSLWDFGYLYSTATADAATLRAPFNYPTIAIDIPTLATTTNDELNKIYFNKSAKSTSDFDAVAIGSDLNFVTVTQSNDKLVVTQLTANTVVEFIDQYGKKGLIKVLQVNGTNGSDGFIRIAIKVQR